MIEPLYDKVVVKREDPEKIRESGIVIPLPAQQASNYASVVAVGPGRMNNVSGQVVPLTVKVGDNVMISQYTNTTITIDEIDYLLIAEAEIWGIIK